MRQDTIEFARLLSEIRAVGLQDGQAEALSRSMDAGPEVIGGIFERAEVVWERAKRQAVERQQRDSAFVVLMNRFGAAPRIIKDVPVEWKDAEAWLLERLRDFVFDGVWLDRFRPIAEAEVPGAQAARFIVQGSVATELSETIAEIVTGRMAELGVKGAVVAACERQHVGQRADGRAVVRSGVLVTVDWSGLKISREYDLETAA